MPASGQETGKSAWLYFGAVAAGVKGSIPDVRFVVGSAFAFSLEAGEIVSASRVSMNPTGIQSILHPTDFSRGDEGAFAHALRMGLAYRTVLHLLHVGTLEEQAGWTDFPGFAETLSRWGLLEPGAHHRDLASLGLQVRKAQKMSDDPAEAISRFVVLHDVDLLVLDAPATRIEPAAPPWTCGGDREDLGHADAVRPTEGSRFCGCDHGRREPAPHPSAGGSRTASPPCHRDGGRPHPPGWA